MKDPFCFAAPSILYKISIIWLEKLRYWFCPSKVNTGKQRELQLFPHLNTALRRHLYCMDCIWIVFDTISTIGKTYFIHSWILEEGDFSTGSRQWKQRLTKKLPGQRDIQQARGWRMEVLCRKRYREAVEGEERREQLRRPAQKLGKNVRTPTIFEGHILAFTWTMNRIAG